MVSCVDPYFKNDYDDNTPTSGKLKIQYDEGLALHVLNQVYTFESQYHNAHVEVKETTENEAIEAMYKDSCRAIIISRPLSEKEMKQFASKQLVPKFSIVAYSGITFIANASLPLSSISYTALQKLLGQSDLLTDSLGNQITVQIILDKKNSSVIHYLSDSVLQGKKFAAHCAVLNSSKEAIEYVIEHKNAIACIDYAWLSDVDDPLYKNNKDLLKFLAVQKDTSKAIYPSQSSFKLKTYPLMRGVYVYRRTGEFTLAKGLESFIAGPKGQMTFLKQGLLPSVQQERNIHVNFEPVQSP